MSEDRDERAGGRLPPPAFPPGSRARAYRVQDDGSETLDFIEPDEEIPPRSAKPTGGVAQGIGPAVGRAPLPIDPPEHRDPHVRDLTLALSKLTEAVRRRGESGLHATPRMSRFEATLRAYCVGYLAGRRGESEEGLEPPPSSG